MKKKTTFHKNKDYMSKIETNTKLVKRFIPTCYTKNAKKNELIFPLLLTQNGWI